MEALLHPDNVNPVYYPFFQTTKRYCNLRGGSGSSKSWTAAQKCLSWLLNPYGHKERILVLRKVGRTVRNSVYALFDDQIKMYNLAVSPKIATLSFIAANGNEIITAGVDDVEKLKSITGITKIWIEEATEFTETDFEQIDLRLRGMHLSRGDAKQGFPDAYFQIIITYNPIHEKHWIKRYFWDTQEEGGSYDAETMFNLVTTFRDNRFIDDQYKVKLEKLIATNPNLYRIYNLGEWGVEQNENSWLHAFDYGRHVRKTLPFLPTYPVYLSFDFNRDPITCTAIQMSPQKGAANSFIHFLREFGGKKQLRDLCFELKTAFPYSILYVTGDMSGNQGDEGYDNPNTTKYTLIKAYLGISKKNLQQNVYNLKHDTSRLLCNAMFEQYPNLYISAAGCPTLINDCIIACVDEDSSKPHALKKDRDVYKMDYFDDMRYFLQRYFTEFARSNYFELHLPQ